MVKVRPEEATWDKIINIATFNFFIHLEDGKSINSIVRKLHNNFSYFFKMGKEFEKIGLLVFPYRNKKNNSSIIELTKKGRLIQTYLKNLQAQIGSENIENCLANFKKRFENINNKTRILFPESKKL